jgi:hypothetical protein
MWNPPSGELILSRNKKIITNPPGEWTYIIPKGLVLYQDTNEQKPLFKTPKGLDRLEKYKQENDGKSFPIFDIPKGLTVLDQSIANGDYSIEGYTRDFCIERKQISDFCSYIGVERHKTIIKMERLREMQWAGLVIEVSETELLKGYIHSQLEPNHIRGALVSFEVRYGIHIFMDPDREHIKRWVLDRAIKFWRIMQEIKKEE